MHAPASQAWGLYGCLWQEFTNTTLEFQVAYICDGGDVEVEVMFTLTFFGKLFWRYSATYAMIEHTIAIAPTCVMCSLLRWHVPRSLIVR